MTTQDDEDNTVFIADEAPMWVSRPSAGAIAERVGVTTREWLEYCRTWDNSISTVSYTGWPNRQAVRGCAQDSKEKAKRM
jgi:hypothetical protein